MSGDAAGLDQAVAPQRATSITCPATGTLDYRCADATYAIGHELGHTFGLQHSCDAYPGPQCGNSIMAQARCQYLGYASSNAMPHQHNISKVELLEQKIQAIGMSPDGGVCLPGMIRLAIAEHVNGIDRSVSWR